VGKEKREAWVFENDISWKGPECTTSKWGGRREDLTRKRPHAQRPATLGWKRRLGKEGEAWPL